MISVIIRSFNNGNTIEKCIESVLNQSLSLKDIEIIVVDDGSSDDSLDKIAKYKSNIKFFQTSRLGAIKALNYGIRKAKGDLFTILDSDDYLPNNALDSLLAGFKDSNVVAVLGDYYEILTDTGERQLFTTQDNYFLSLAGGILLKKEVVAKLGYYDEKLFFPEYDLLVKILSKYNIVHISKIVYYYCRQSASLTKSVKDVRNGVKQLEERYGKKLPIRQY